MGIACRDADLAHLSVAHVAALAPTSWAIGGCFRIDNQNAGEIQTLICKGGLDSTTRATYHLAYINGILRLGFVDTAGSLKVLSVVQMLTTSFWYSILGRYDLATNLLALYLAQRETPTGQVPASAYTLIGSSTMTGATPYASTQAVRIGCGVASDGTLQDGADISVSEVFVYDSAIAVATLDARLGTRLGPNVSGLVLSLPCDDGDDCLTSSGTNIAADHSGNGRNATFINSPTWTDDPLDLSYQVGYLGNGFLGWYAAHIAYNATVAASDADSAYPASELLQVKQGRPTRTTGVVGAKTFTYGFSRVVSVGAIGIFNHNFTSAATISLSFNNGGGALYTEALRYHPKRLIHVLPREQQYLNMVLSVTDAANADGYLQIGALVAFQCFSFSRPIPPEDEAWSQRDLSVEVQTQHRSLTGRSQSIGDELAASLPMLPRGQQLELRRILQIVGGGAYVLLAADPKRALYRRSIYGPLSKLPSYSPGEGSWTFANTAGIAIQGDHA